MVRCNVSVVRKQPPLYLTKSPLVFVLAQVKFAPILKMSDYVPGIQEKLRKAGFPGYELRTTQEITFGPSLLKLESKRWFFFDRDRASSFILANDFGVLTTRKYDRFEQFAEILRRVLGILGEDSAPAFSDRLGLRYVDLIREAEGESFRDYLHESLHGLSAAGLQAKSTLVQSYTNAETDQGVLSVRIWQNRDGKPLPPDIEVDEFSQESRNLRQGELLTVLDIDHFSELRRDFEVDLLMNSMSALHDGSDRAFRACVTDVALRRWGNKGNS